MSEAMSKPPNTLTSDDVLDLMNSSPNNPHRKAGPAITPQGSSQPQQSQDRRPDLRSFLRGYHRVTVAEACSKMVADNVDAWVWFLGSWIQVDAGEVNSVIARANEDKQSFCRSYLKDELGFSDAKYEDIKAQFDEVEIDNPVGIYESNDGNRVALVIRK